MALTVNMVTFDTHDAPALAAWWADHLGGQVQAHGDEFVMVLPTVPGQPALGFQRVEDTTPGKNRVHVDLGVEDPGAAVERFLASGAGRVADHTLPDGFAWTVLSDPHGNQFCVSQVHAP